MSEQTYSTVNVTKGRGGWGGDLSLTPTAEKNVVLSVTSGGIHPVAARIAELTGGTAVDGFTNHVEDAKVMCAVINCGGTARIGVYPKKRIPTVDVYPGEPGGPLAQFITEDIFVSAVALTNVTPVDGTHTTEPVTSEEPAEAADPAVAETATDTPSGSLPSKQERMAQTGAAMASGSGLLARFSGVVVGFGSVIGHIINTLLSSGRQAIQLCISTIIPFMAYVSLLIGIVTYTGISEAIAWGVTPLVQNPLGLVLLGLITAIPILSPILGPGAAIAQVVGVLMGTQIGQGNLPVQYALPTLFAINGQVGCDFVPVGLSLAEAKAETVSIGVPAILFSRLITSPVAVLIAYFAGFLVH
ncbi:PTS glucitol/sorbitol transporter subunit IIB [Brachybacterium phenoliresistens]|uniref:PTS glucitol/sorbitol transporter subunit IIB n=1 Tax=Brachybacterium phenoliresistens TaxID=396014 RepID=UPI0031D045E9